MNWRRALNLLKPLFSGFQKYCSRYRIEEVIVSPLLGDFVVEDVMHSEHMWKSNALNAR